MSDEKLNKNSKTYENLKTAFAGESQAAVRYMLFAKKAKKDGFCHIEDILNRIAHNEIEHAKIWYKKLNDGMPLTLKNLKSAAEGEKYEWQDMYVQFAKDARKEGYEEIAVLCEQIADIEQDHEKTYNKLIEMMEKDEIFNSTEKCYWICQNCGHIHFGERPPESCPVCKHPISYFKRY